MTMSAKRNSVQKVTEMERCGCFGSAFSVKPSKVKDSWSLGEPLFDDKVEDGEKESSYDDHSINKGNEETEFHSPVKRSEEIIRGKILKGLICREIAVKESHELICLEDEDGNKMVNEYVRECKIGEGSYAKVVLYRSKVDQKHYAIKGFHKSHLLKLRVAPSEAAMTDVLREVMIMKFLSHPNIVNLVEVIDDPTTNHFYMGKWIDEATGPLGGLRQSTA
ncbi:hypothetical protein Leryth_023028 [Lithospermum erythrorhizon]|nr:hypothetical protein Leryth_023028 [Lithospermum erythrorhizon]